MDILAPAAGTRPRAEIRVTPDPPGARLVRKEFECAGAGGSGSTEPAAPGPETAMSHFVVIVCLPPTPPERLPGALTEALAPFDEDREVEPYRQYIEDWQAQYQEALEFYAECPQYRPAGLDEQDVLAVLSAYEDCEVVKEVSEDSSIVMYYLMSTFNPRSTWDWWEVGGRWKGYFPVKPEHAGDPALITGAPGVLGNHPARGEADGGPIRLLDLAGLRAAEAAKAEEHYDGYQELVEGLPEAQPWSHFADLHEADQEGYPLDQASQDYQAQPRVQAAKTSVEYEPTYGFDPVAYFAVTREEAAARGAAQAVPGFALLDLDGQWQDGEDENAAYLDRANTYLDALDPDTLLVAVDCHS